jgi:hypothetical protein
MTSIEDKKEQERERDRQYRLRRKAEEELKTQLGLNNPVTTPNEELSLETNGEIHCSECNKTIPRHLFREEFYPVVESKAIFNLLVTGKKTGKTTTMALLHIWYLMNHSEGEFL